MFGAVKVRTMNSYFPYNLGLYLLTQDTGALLSSHDYVQTNDTVSEEVDSHIVAPYRWLYRLAV
jgi:hypothetical protein